MLVRRFGRPGLLGTMARTAVVAGTAHATVNALNRRGARRAEQEAEAQQYEQQQLTEQLQTAAAPAPAGGIGDQLAELSKLHDAGALSDEEFAAAKQRLLTS